MTKISKKRTSKKKKQSKRASSPKINPIDLIPAGYNPRVMDDKARSGLKKSMEEFNDISGITWNQKTKNIVTGHHRWQNLVDEYGLEKLDFEHLKGDRYAIISDGKDTNYTLRVVSWDDAKEKAANISANSHKLEGQFTAELDGLLADLKDNWDGELFEDLRFDELSSFLEEGSGGVGFPDDDWDSDIGKIEKTNENQTTMFETISILVSEEEDLVEIKEILMSTLKGRKIEIR